MIFSNMCQIFSNGHISRDEKFYGWCQTFFHECKEKCAQKIRKALDQNKFGSKKISLVFSLNMLFQEEDKFWQQINPLPLAECDYCIPFRLSLSLFPIFLFLHYHHHHCRSFIIIIIIVVISIFFSANTQTLHQRVWGVVLIFGDVHILVACLILSLVFSIWQGVVWIKIKDTEIHLFVLSMKGWFLCLLGFNMIVRKQIKNGSDFRWCAYFSSLLDIVSCLFHINSGFKPNISHEIQIFIESTYIKWISCQPRW